MKKKRKMTKKEMKGGVDPHNPMQVHESGIQIMGPRPSLLADLRGPTSSKIKKVIGWVSLPFDYLEPVSWYRYFERWNSYTKDKSKNMIYKKNQLNDITQLITKINEENKKFESILDNSDEVSKLTTDKHREIKKRKKDFEYLIPIFERIKNQLGDKKEHRLKTKVWKKRIVPYLDHFNIERKFQYEGIKEDEHKDKEAEMEFIENEQKMDNDLQQAKAKAEAAAGSTPGLNIEGNIKAKCICVTSEKFEELVAAASQPTLTLEKGSELKGESPTDQVEEAAAEAAAEEEAAEEAKKREEEEAKRKEEEAKKREAERQAAAEEEEAKKRKEAERQATQEENQHKATYANIDKELEQLLKTYKITSENKNKARRRLSISSDKITQAAVNKQDTEFNEDQYKIIIKALEDPQQIRLFKNQSQQYKDKYKQAFNTIKEAMEKLNNKNPEDKKKLDQLITLIEDKLMLRALQLSTTQEVANKAKELLPEDPVYDVAGPGNNPHTDTSEEVEETYAEARKSNN